MKFSVIALSALLLVSCGGGGGDDLQTGELQSSPIVATYPLLAAYRSYVSVPQSYNMVLSGTCSGTATRVSTAVANTTFNGQPALVKTTDGTVAIASCSRPEIVPDTTSTVTRTYFDMNYRLVGVQSDQDPPVVFSDVAVLPETVSPGDSGTAARSPAVTLSWRVQAETDTTALVYLRSINPLAVEDQIFRISTDGKLTYVRDEAVALGIYTFVLTPVDSR